MYFECWTPTVQTEVDVISNVPSRLSNANPMSSHPAKSSFIHLHFILQLKRHIETSNFKGFSNNGWIIMRNSDLFAFKSMGNWSSGNPKEWQRAVSWMRCFDWEGVRRCWNMQRWTSLSGCKAASVSRVWIFVQFGCEIVMMIGVMLWWNEEKDYQGGLRFGICFENWENVMLRCFECCWSWKVMVPGKATRILICSLAWLWTVITKCRIMYENRVRLGQSQTCENQPRRSWNYSMDSHDFDSVMCVVLVQVLR